MLSSSQSPEKDWTYAGPVALSHPDWCQHLSCIFGLEHLDSFWPSKYHHRTPATSPKCSGLGSRDHMTKSLGELHWLRIRFRIVYKLYMMTHKVDIGCSPGYIKEILQPTVGLPNRTFIIHHQLRTTLPTSQDWRAGFLVCQFCHMEQSTT